MIRYLNLIPKASSAASASAMTDSILNLRGQNPSSPTSQNDDLATRIHQGDDSTGETFGFVLKHCSLILIAPIATFFLTKLVLLERFLGFETDGISTNVVSAICAVVVLHIGLGLFIYRAYFAESPQPKVRIGKQE